MFGKRSDVQAKVTFFSYTDDKVNTRILTEN